jgi:hypothetical protein
MNVVNMNNGKSKFLCVLKDTPTDNENRDFLS